MTPLLKAVLDEILATNLWELKLLGMQMIVERLAIAAFDMRHVNFGYFALRPSIPDMEPEPRSGPSCQSSAMKA